MAKNRGFLGKEEKYLGKLPGGINYLLLIGIDEYQSVKKLQNAVRDAKGIARVLLNRYQFEEENTIQLYNEDATREKILSVLDTLAEKITEEDNLLIYYAGHGFYRENLKIGYWVPVDGYHNKFSTFINHSVIRDYIGAIPAHHTLLIVDSCFSGNFLRNRGREISPSVIHASKVGRFPSRWCLAAGMIEKVSDGYIGDHSPFARSLITFLEKNNESLFPLQDMIVHVCKATSYNSDQTPIGGTILRSGDQNGQFVFALKKEENKSSVKAINTNLTNIAESYSFKDKREISLPFPQAKKKLFMSIGIGLVVIGLTISGSFIYPPIKDSLMSDEDYYLSAFGIGDSDKILLLPFEEYQNCIAEDASNEINIRNIMNLFQETENLNIRVKFMGEGACPKNSDEARRIGLIYNADLVVWGNYQEIKNDTSKLHIRYIFPRNTNNFLGSLDKNLGEIALGDNYDLREGYLSGNIEDIVLWLSGIILLREEKYHKSISFLEQINAKETHESANLYHLLAKCYQGIKQYDKVLQAYNQAILLNPKNANSYYNRGLLYQYLKQEDQAFADFSEAIHLNPKHLKALSSRNLLIHMSREDDDYINKTQLLSGINMDTIVSEFYELEYEPDFDQIEDLYDVGDVNDQDLSYNFFSDGKKLELGGRYFDAIDAYNNAIQETPEESKYYYARAKAYEKINRLRMAILDYTIAIQLNPTNSDLYLQRGYSHERILNYYEALESYSEYISLLPEATIAYLYRGNAYQLVNLPKKALIDFEKAISLSPNEATGYYFRAVYHQKQKNLNLALDDFTQAIKNNPGYVSVYRERGKMYEEQGNYVEALEDFNKVLLFNPTDIYILTKRAKIHIELGLQAKAIADLKRALYISPGNLHLKKMLEKVKNT